VPVGYPAQDYDRLLVLAREQGVGTIGIRVLAGGALSGQLARHPIAIPSVSPIASGPDYAADAARARAFEPLVAQGHAGSVVEAALRFAVTALSTVLIGCSDLAQLEFAATAVNKGPLSPAALTTLQQLWGQVSST
jgi:aryl-alcohol dehydrogenase-like predicted oxidoreductase